MVGRLGIKLGAGQLDAYLAEFSATGAGTLKQHEFVSLMAKLQGRLGATANPNVISKVAQRSRGVTATSR